MAPRAILCWAGRGGVSPADLSNLARPGAGPGRAHQPSPSSAQGSFTLSSISSWMIEPDRHDNITAQPSATPSTRPRTHRPAHIPRHPPSFTPSLNVVCGAADDKIVFWTDIINICMNLILTHSQYFGIYPAKKET